MKPIWDLWHRKKGWQNCLPFMKLCLKKVRSEPYMKLFFHLKDCKILWNFSLPLWTFYLSNQWYRVRYSHQEMPDHRFSQAILWNMLNSEMQYKLNNWVNLLLTAFKLKVQLLEAVVSYRIYPFVPNVMAFRDPGLLCSLFLSAQEVDLICTKAHKGTKSPHT